MKVVEFLVTCSLVILGTCGAFTVSTQQKNRFLPTSISTASNSHRTSSTSSFSPRDLKEDYHNVAGARTHHSVQSVQLHATPDLEVIALVAGQENYGLAIVALGEALWSFLEAPSWSHAKVFIPATVAAVILVAVSGPMVTNASDPESIKLGLEIATGVSVGLGASYLARLLAPYSPSAKEIAFGGLLVAMAGFFSFSQNLIVDGFLSLPSFPSLPSIFPQNVFSGEDSSDFF